MSLINCKVELGLNAFGYTGGNFVLDDDTLGVLGTSQLSGLEFYDVTQYGRSVSVQRGRSRQLEYFNAGSASVSFDNRTRIFDPLNEDSIFYPAIEPRCLIRITSQDLPVFYGVVNDWDLRFDIADNDTASISCSDAFSVLSNQLLSGHNPSAELTGQRIDKVLRRTEVDYRGGRQIATGRSEVGGGSTYAVADETNVLNYLRQLERSEIGSLYVAANGDLIFKERSQIPDTPTLDFADDGTGIPYQTLENLYGDELLYNYIRAQSPAGAEQIASDTASITQYQVSQLAITELLNNSTGVVLSIAQTVLGQYKMPKVRLTGFTVQMLGLSEAQQLEVLNADLTSFMNLTKTFATGTPSSFTQKSVITGISHEIQPGSHRVTFAVENAESLMSFVLGDEFAGQLNYGALDF